MGGSQTKEAMNKPIPCQDATPPKEPNLFKRQLPIDPRSPTDNITRTPIIVDSTPNEVKMLDPRSPTYGIERTPLMFTGLPGQDNPVAQKMEETMETSPQLMPHVERAPLSQPEETGDADMTTPQKPPAVPVHLDFMDIPDIDAEDGSPLLQNVEQQPLLPQVEPTPVQPKLTSQPKKLFLEDQPAPAEAVRQAPVSRSLGLAARDANSPRSIVQSKQRRQVAKSMGGVGNHIGIDKENFAH